MVHHAAIFYACADFSVSVDPVHKSLVNSCGLRHRRISTSLLRETLSKGNFSKDDIAKMCWTVYTLLSGDVRSQFLMS